MNRIEDIVPPLELCKLIPKGELGFSYAHWAFVWAKDNETVGGEKIIGWWQIVTVAELIFSSSRPTDEQRKELLDAWAGGNENAAVICEKAYPAPTLQELLMGIEESGLYCPTCYHQANRWDVSCEDDAVDEDANNLPCLYEAEDYDNPATAALRLWFDVNGIEVKE